MVYKPTRLYLDVGGVAGKGPRHWSVSGAPEWEFVVTSTGRRGFLVAPTTS